MTLCRIGSFETFGFRNRAAATPVSQVLPQLAKLTVAMERHIAD